MYKIDKIYFINLDRRPDRYEHFLKECSKHNIPYDKIHRYSAIDGLTYNFSLEEERLFNRVDYLNQPYKKKIMGNQMSHYYILKDMIENDYDNIIICQDDIIFNKDFIKDINDVTNNLSVDSEIINFAFHEFASFDKFIPWDFSKKNIMIKKKINNYISLLKDTTNPCSLGYIVTKKGAKNLLNYFNNYGFFRATDWNYNDYLIRKKIYYGTNKVLATGNPHLGSDIFT